MALRSKDLWTRGRKVIQVLKPLFQALNLVDRYGSNMGYLYEAMNKVEDAIKQHCNINPCNKSEQVHLQTILNIIKKCWRECQVNNHPMHAAAAFLNPAFLWSKEFVEDSKMEQCLKFLKQLVIEEEEGEAFVKQLKLYRIKTPDLFTDAAVKFVNQVHPRKWWEIFGDGLPILKKYAVRVLSQPCASSICDSVWLPNSSNDELGMNMVAMENFNRMRPQEFDIIDLEKFSGLPGCDLQHIRRCLGQRQDPDDFDYYDLLVINDPPYLFRDQNPLPVDFQFHFVDFGFWR
ncbi:hypothetical protein CCACVL1_14328 [Corchorus capsularis]|uniref:HAT C-terminal dimerisation domain-containing protein n=1 Tax=Corchorus capsularis TaxID=210143 RepID=A0A1R3I7E1_COCAP|nr:hypothetical protein CCACVL1_14328 [Corchorus capsularis]